MQKEALVIIMNFCFSSFLTASPEGLKTYQWLIRGAGEGYP
jgi:hypothetical protein